MFMSPWEFDGRIVSESLEREVRRLETTCPPKHPHSRGIVICGGGGYFPSAYVLVRMLRRLGSTLPVELWLRAPDEYDERMSVALKDANIRIRDASKVLRPRREISGWQLKPFAILHSDFSEVLYIDADNVPLCNPEYLFDSPQFQQTGALFWPDFGHLSMDNPIWEICRIPFVDEPEFESGQILIDKVRCWKELLLTMWFNWRKDFFDQYILGDKDTFHLAFRKLGTPFAMTSTPVRALDRTMCQHDFEGARIFQHRNRDKWSIERENQTIFGFEREAECKEILRELKALWVQHDHRGRLISFPETTERSRAATEKLTNNVFIYRRVGFDEREMAFSRNGQIDLGNGAQESRWHLGERAGRLTLTILSKDAVTCVLRQSTDGIWRGRWKAFERMPVELLLKRDHTQYDSRTAKQKTHQAKLIFRAPLNAYTGYGLHACQIGGLLLEKGVDFAVRATDINETFAPLPNGIRKRISAKELDAQWELLLTPPGHCPVDGRKTAYFTMWESSKLRSDLVRNLNASECVIVPSAWNRSAFTASGVSRPIHTVPLGINTDVFSYRPMDKSGPCVFGAAGRLESGGVRKGLSRVIDIFMKAFPKEADARLHLKVFPDCGIETVDDPRILITRAFYSERELADWYGRLTCFVSLARGEGWGLMQHQALATGRPLISPLFGGLLEFFSEEMGYSLDFRLVPASGLYHGCGDWAEVNEDSAIAAMRCVYENRSDAERRGRLAAPKVSHLSWRRAHHKLLTVLSEIGAISETMISEQVAGNGHFGAATTQPNYLDAALAIK